MDREGEVGERHDRRMLAPKLVRHVQPVNRILADLLQNRRAQFLCRINPALKDCHPQRVRIRECLCFQVSLYIYRQRQYYCHATILAQPCLPTHFAKLDLSAPPRRTNLPSFAQIQIGWDGKSSLHLEEPLVAPELQILWQLHHDDSNIDESDDEEKDDLEHGDEIQEESSKHLEQQSIEAGSPGYARFCRYLDSALLYILRYFSHCTFWYYGLTRRNERYYIGNTEYQPVSVIEEVLGISARVLPCFEKIHNEIEGSFQFLSTQVSETIRDQTRALVHDTEADIRNGIIEVLNFLHSTAPALIIAPPSILPPPIFVYNDEQSESEDEDGDHIWSHITISRDQTRSSDFEKVKLLILRSRGYKPGTEETLDAFGFPIPPPPPPPVGLLPPPPPPPPVPVPALPLFYTTGVSDKTQPETLPLLFQTRSKTVGYDSRGIDSGSPEVSDMYSTPSGHTIVQRDMLNHSEMIHLPVVKNPMDDLLRRISLLETENHGLKSSQGSGQEIQIIYCISEVQNQLSTYLDEPTWAIGPRGEAVPKAHFPIPDFEGYLRQKHNMAFSVQKHYNLGDQEEEVRKAAKDKRELPRLKPVTELLRLESQDMREAFKAFLNCNPNIEKEIPQFDPTQAFIAPYLFWYHHRATASFDRLSETHRALMERMTNWINENYGDLYDRVQAQLARRVVSFDSMPFLVKPGDAMLVRQKVSEQNKEISGAVADGYLASITPRTLVKDTQSRLMQQTMSKEKQKERFWKWTGPVWSYKYDGSFYKKTDMLEVKMKADTLDKETAISELNAFPMRFASEETRALLEKRGREFWTCREKRLVSYYDKEGTYGSAERFMVDFHTYKQLHSTETSFKREYSSIHNPGLTRIESSAMESDEPPPDPEIYVFPATIPAFNLHSKKWVDLEVDNFRQVKWNKQSFKHLVIEPDSKELVQALITNQIAREQGTDIVESKGNGLIILLHGGPGTGKTFTAESVAEMAEKPLYRVTCGDIGTKPVEVEQYLESVLHLSKSWGCVVLLDEADVFLEQRSLTDLERNALVSVFLRVLEYYEGILILTSNHVGTFDEAFKSRIQLALHYENLDRSQRQKIWMNFLGRLRDMNNKALVTEKGAQKSDPIDIDFDDISCYMSELADIEMNGRQIRNAITTARQLAKFKKEQMTYKHLKHVIGVSSKFDRYLEGVREGFTDDQIMRDGGIR